MPEIIIRGARVHNLKSVSLKIPKNKFVIFTGVSGSGKSSLAFDTVYAEGQRRYVESLSSYARQFLGIMEKPDVDFIDGLSPAIAIEQRGISKNPRSTIATTTEIYDYLRLLFARVGEAFCYNCGRPVRQMTIDEIVDDILTLPEGTPVEIQAPIVQAKKGEFRDIVKKLAKRGFTRIVLDNELKRTDEKFSIDKKKKHDIEIEIDRLKIREGVRTRLTQSVETGLAEADGIVFVKVNDEVKIYNEKLACAHCKISYNEISPRSFSFNNPYGACTECHGLGTNMEIDSESVIADSELSINEGAIAVWGDASRKGDLPKLARKFGFSLNTPWQNLPEEIRDIIMTGLDEKKQYEMNVRFEGIMPYLKRLYLSTDSDWMKYEIEKYMTFQPCPVCNGTRLNREALSVSINGMNIAQVTAMNVEDARKWFSSDLKLSAQSKEIAGEILNEIDKRLGFLFDVGLEYLTLDRATETLSGGEEQRVRLATQIGSGLTGVLYVLDEPSVGLHQRDIKRLIDTLLHLRDIGNSVLIVEHDRQFIEAGDHIIDLGPGAGEHGGKVVFQGSYEEMLASAESVTGEYLKRSTKVSPISRRKIINKRAITIHGAREHNLKNIDVKIPLGMFVCVTGVSGSGKSTLVNDILYNALRRYFHQSRHIAGEHDSIENLHLLDKVINIDQSSIGRTPRSNPATYTGVFTPIRELFASMKEAKMRGYKPGRFSFNVRGGRCEACEGAGVKKIEMHFLPDIYVTCEVCRGHRFNAETLQVKFRSKNISEVLDMSVEEAAELFTDIPRISGKLKLLTDVGLGYIKLGQRAPSLSGGEAQRIKLAKELSKQDTGNTIYIMDEPTTGLHFKDVDMLLAVLKRLVEKGNTLVIIEHNPDVIKCADWIIDLGPEGGEKGGSIVAQGTPEDITRVKASMTGYYLKKEGI